MIGILFGLKGSSWDGSYCWLKRDYDVLFARLPDESRLCKALVTHRDWCNFLLTAPTLFTVIDAHSIELIFPIREGRKGKDKGRWVSGIKQCWLLDKCGRVVEWSWAPRRTPDKHFNPLVAGFDGQTITLAEIGFRAPGNRKDRRGKFQVRQNYKRSPKYLAQEYWVG